MMHDQHVCNALESINEPEEDKEINEVARSFDPPVSDHPLHQYFPMARLLSSNEVKFYHLTTPSV
jgi:hypothetical protein